MNYDEKFIYPLNVKRFNRRIVILNTPDLYDLVGSGFSEDSDYDTASKPGYCLHTQNQNMIPTPHPDPQNMIPPPRPDSEYDTASTPGLRI